MSVTDSQEMLIDELIGDGVFDPPPMPAGMFCTGHGLPQSYTGNSDPSQVYEDNRVRDASLLDAGGMGVIQFAAEAIASSVAATIIDSQCSCEGADYDLDGRTIAGPIACNLHEEGRDGFVHDRLEALVLRRLYARPIFAGLDRPTLERLAVDLDRALAETPDKEAE